MDEEVYKILLNGMPVAKFLGYFIIAIFASTIFFILKVNSAINVNSTTKIKWNWRRFFKGFTKFLVTIMIIAAAIIFFKDLSPYIMNLGATGELPEGLELKAEVNPVTAFIIGFTIDRTINTVKEKYIKKR